MLRNMVDVMKNHFLIYRMRLQTFLFVVTDKTICYKLEIIKFRDILDFTQFGSGVVWNRLESIESIRFMNFKLDSMSIRGEKRWNRIGFVQFELSDRQIESTCLELARIESCTTLVEGMPTRHPRVDLEAAFPWRWDDSIYKGTWQKYSATMHLPDM